jgi:rare lipoprotein A
LSGKHARGHIARPSRISLPVVAGGLLAVLLIAAAVASLRLGPSTAKHTAADVNPVAAADPTSAAPSATPVPSRPADRAGRSELREAPPPSKSPSPSPSIAPKAPPPGTGTVTSTGTCGASFYTDGARTANGEPFDPNAFTAASKTLPFNTRVRVTNLANGKSTIVRINDRGPFVTGRCLDLTRAAFGAIASLGSGVINVRFEILA